MRENDLISPSTGCWYPLLHAGDRFAEGDLLGEIRDYFGAVTDEIRAGEDGILLYQCKSLNIIKGDPMIAYGISE